MLSAGNPAPPVGRVRAQGRFEQISRPHSRFGPIWLPERGNGLALLAVLVKIIGPESATATATLVKLESRRCGAAGVQNHTIGDR